MTRRLGAGLDITGAIDGGAEPKNTGNEANPPVLTLAPIASAMHLLPSQIRLLS